MTIRVILVDDHPIVRNGIKGILSESVDIEVIGETGSGKEALLLAQRLKPDVLLLDMELPDLEGIEVARQLQSSNCTVKVLALSAYNDRDYIQGVLEEGAAGYLIKDEPPQMIIEAVRGVAAGQQGWFSRRVSAQMTSWLQNKEDTPTRLSPREMDVLRLIVGGKTNQMIAAELEISEKTVEKVVDMVLRKLSVKSRVEAAVLAIREKLVR